MGRILRRCLGQGKNPNWALGKELSPRACLPLLHVPGPKVCGCPASLQVGFLQQLGTSHPCQWLWGYQRSGHGRAWSARAYARGDGTCGLATWPVRHTDHNELIWRAFEMENVVWRVQTSLFFVCPIELGRAPVGGVGRRRSTYCVPAK